jgi:hypothetical protein
MFFEERESETFGFSLFRFGLIFNPFRIMSAIWVRSRVLLPFFFFYTVLFLFGQFRRLRASRRLAPM